MSMQFPRAQSRHLKSGFQYKSQYFLSVASLLVLDPFSLVVSLPGDVQKLASPDDAQALGEDLPDRFSTTETP